MRRFLLAAAATFVVATPAMARDGSGYVGVDAGALFPKNQHVNGTIDFTDPLVTDFGPRQVATVRFKTGYDVDLNAGYDFGLFRLEGELAYKRAKTKNVDVGNNFVDALNGGAGTSFVDGDFDLDGHVSALSGMLNGLVDFGNNGISGFVGAGIGRARVKELGDSDNTWAWQVLAGVKTALSDNIDVGLKYRYFRTGHLKFANDDFTFTGVNGGSGGTVFLDSRNHFTSHSLLLSLSYNFASAAPPPPPPPPPPPVERGERGK